MDIIAYDQGSVVLLCPQTCRGLDWMRSSLETEHWRWLGWNLGIDYHAIDGVIRAADEEGISIDIDPPAEEPTYADRRG